MRRWILAVSTTALFAACPPGVDPEEDGGTGCEATGCPADQSCDATTRACVPLPGCDATNPCEAGECLDGVCSSCAANLPCTIGFDQNCNLDGGPCLACRAGSCPAELPYCGATGCSECTRDAGCGGDRPYCQGAWCVGCTSDYQCASGERCVGNECRQECYSDSECSALGKPCRAGGCVDCVDSTQCPAGEGCMFGSCRPMLEGDLCANAYPLTLVGGTARVQGTIREAHRADYALSDVYYRLEITEAVSLNADLTFEADSFSPPKPELTVFGGSCGALLDFGHGTTEVRDVYVVPGTYWIRVGTPSSVTQLRRFILHVFTTPGSREVGNSCFNPGLLTVDGVTEQEQVFERDLRSLAHVPVDHCDQQPDLVYEVDVQQRARIEVITDPLEPDGFYEVSWDPPGNCFTDSGRWCSGLEGYSDSLAVGPVEPGRYFLHVRSRSTTGSVRVTLRSWPWHANHTCATAEPLLFDGGVATRSGDCRWTDIGQPACGLTLSRRVQFFTVSTRGMGDRSLQLDLSGRNGGAPPVMYLNEACPPSVANGIRCDDDRRFDGGYSIYRPVLPEGDYLVSLWAQDAYPEVAGPYSLSAKLAAPVYPPVNDSCASPTVLTLDGGTFSVTGTTRGAADDYSCGGGSGTTNGEVIYFVPFTGPARVDAWVRATSPDFDPELGMTADFSSTICGANFGCWDTQDAGHPEHAMEQYWWARDGGTFLVVGTSNGYAGDFELTGTVVPPPANDICANATPLAVGATVTGDLRPASFNGPGCTVTGSGPDVWYEVRMGSNGQMTATLTPNGFDGQLAIHSSCSGGSPSPCFGSVNSTAVDGVEVLTFPVDRNTSYYLGVYSASGQEGTYSLRLSSP